MVADTVGQHCLEQLGLVVINGDPKRQASVDMDLLLGKMFCNGLGNFLRSHTPPLEALQQEFSVKYKFVAVNDAENERVLVLTACESVLDARVRLAPRHSHGLTDLK
jgi:hypothetical protein